MVTVDLQQLGALMAPLRERAVATKVLGDRKIIVASEAPEESVILLRASQSERIANALRECGTARHRDLRVLSCANAARAAIALGGPIARGGTTGFGHSLLTSIVPRR